MPLNRRSFLSLTAASAVPASLVAAGINTAGAGAQSLEAPGVNTGPRVTGLPFLHGVASGDPLPRSVILWTRITPERDALPGSGLGADVSVDWEVATDSGFGNIVAQGNTVATAASDHTVHVDAGGLEPATEYFYRFIVADGDYAGQVSPIGRTKTAPAAQAQVSELNFALASCANWESGYFGAYRHMADYGSNLDFVAFVGDYIYEYGIGEYAGKHGVVRPHSPAQEIVTLRDYRIRYGQYRGDKNLQDAHAAAPWIVMWDDHESANNSWREGAENHTDGRAEGDWATRRAAALQAYREWQPMRVTSTTDTGRLYRTFTFGDLMELTMLDLRSYRDAETSPANFGAADRTMLGAEQFNWLRAVIERTQAKWSAVGNSVMISPLKILTLPDPQQDAEVDQALAFVKQQSTGEAINSDQWDGYAAERDRVLKLFADKGTNALFLTGDIHSEWVNSIYSQNREIGVEFVCTSISSPNIDDLLTTYTGIEHEPDNSTSLLVEGMLSDANPWVNHVDFDAHGYCRIHLEADEATCEFIRVLDVENADSKAAPALKRTWRPGEGVS